MLNQFLKEISILKKKEKLLDSIAPYLNEYFHYKDTNKKLAAHALNHIEEYLIAFNNLEE